MSARTQFEHLMFRAGYLPEGILNHEPAVNAPIPTTVESTSARFGQETYRAELDTDGRLLTVSIDGRGTGPYQVRTWTSENTYVDKLANGDTHSVVDAGPDRQVVTRVNGHKSTLIAIGSHNGLVSVIAQDNPDNIGFGDRPVVNLASMTEDGKILTEEEWPYHDYYGDPFWPISTRTWEYDDDGNLTSIVRRIGGRSEMGAVSFTEKFDRTDSKLKIVGKYPDGMSGWEQTREYDSEGRVEIIRDRVFVPTSAIRDVVLELSYE